ncbi:hypothetical protein C6380_14270 [Pseudomonas syringae pv. actinidiae]|nr:hypothetical protein BUE61_22635 [Pseudomonas syringae pv. actinidiae]PBK54253.1 hypothetical protein BUE60_10440 [Pseudomonas syringae pv. actinidiae]RJX53461.1 hypothetical protein C6379_17415 [Pseudomonas syringae pv. actinidiae]RJX55579.1 hypothetical protein C6380_14270 [Pseudomonas syringae pv. actinidiae]RJX63861.1 hypothetical protein C6383_05105 [Pseudomonas syringae pv. actinidiae]
MSFLRLMAVVAMSLISPFASAKNIYQEGTKGHELARFAESVLPESVTPYFILQNDKGFFYSQVSQNQRAQVLSQESEIAMLRGLKPVRNSAVAYADFVKETPEGALRKVCRVVFVDPKRAVIGSTLMHELMHCRIQSAQLDDSFREKIMDAAYLSKGVERSHAYVNFEEVLARAMSLAFMVNYGIKEDADFFKHRLSAKYPSNPGPKSMGRVIHLCIDKGACSIDPDHLAERLLSDEVFRSLMSQDMKDNYEVKSHG